MSESDDQISVRANVLGLDGNELEVSVEPQRITILGKKEMSATESEDRKIEYTDRAPDQILHMIDLAAEVIPERAVVELQAGLLRFELPKATKQKPKKEIAAA